VVGLAALVAAVEVEEDTRERTERAELPPPSRPQRRPSSSAGFSSFLSGLLGSVTKTASVSSCPGKCIHALASLMCDTVLEEVQCPTSNMRCCVEKGTKGGQAPPRDSAIPGLGLSMPPRPSGSPPKNPLSRQEEEESEATTENTEQTTKKKKKKRKKERTTTTTTTEAPTTSKAKTTEEPSKDSEDEDEDEDAQKTTVCPGVCVADRISCFCEAILDIPSLCKENLRCCVAKKIFGSENTPEELIFPKEDKRCKSGSSNEEEDEEEEEEEEEEIMETSESKNKLALAKEKLKKAEERKEKERKEMEAKKRKEELEKQRKKKKKEEEQSATSPEGRCRGTCVTGFFSLLCDEIDRNAACPGQGRCCITKSPPRPPRPGKEPPARLPPPPKKPIRKPRPPPPTRPPPPSKKNGCPGVCIPEVMLSLCAPPSVVSPKGGCPKGTFCCDHKGQNPLTRGDQPPPPPRPTPPPRRPAPPPPPQNNGPDFSSLFLQMAPSLIGAATGSQSTAQTVTSLLPLLGMLGPMLSSNRRTPPPPQQNYRPQPTRAPVTRAPTTTTQKTTTTTEKADPRPECPGTCIAPYLSFTCFGNAETSDLFGCAKKKTICCSPKSAVKEENERIQRERSALRKPPPRLPTQRDKPPRFWQQQEQHPRRNDTQHEVIPYEPYPFPTTDERPPFVNPVTNKYVCGVKGTYRSGRVVGGEDAAPGEWCWQVALINSLNQYLCGGALIGQSWVLTAAHCVTNIVRAGDAIYVRVGDHDLTQKFGSPGAQTLRVATTYIHHNHNSQTLDNDIALLKLHGDAELKEGVCLVCLPARGTSQATGKKCTVTGYGYMGETGPIPLRIREARVPIVNDNECVRKINTVTEKIFILPASSFCAGGIKGHDACQGDGGGPLVCEDSGYHELTGLVSWGFGCGRKDVPGVYVKVSSFIGWINQIISVNNS